MKHGCSTGHAALGLGMLASALAAAALSCSDPVYDSEITALGPESDGIPVGEYHRAGQPCELCHSSGGPASSSTFSVAGTVFAQQSDVVGVDSATVAMTDTTGSSYTVQTNCVGNFYVTPSQWNPAFPILTRVYKGGVARTMQGQIGRERSCANCHKDPFTSYEKLSSVGHVYLYSPDDQVPSPPMCPVNPRVGGGTK